MKRAQRFKQGSVVFDERRKTWNFLWWENGRRKSKRLGGITDLPTKTLAWKAAKPLRDALQITRPTTEPTVQDVASRYEAEKMPTRANSRRNCRSWLKNHVIPKWGQIPIAAIEARPVELWLRELPLAPKSKGHVKAALHALIEFAMWAGVLSVGRNPMELVTVKGITKRVKRRRILSVDEFLRVLSELKDHFRLTILLCLCFGLRISEALGLKWSDVNWLKGTLKIERAICEQKVDTVKSSESEKELVMAAELVERLAAWKMVTEFSGQDDWIFASPMQIGRLPYSYTGVWRELQRATKAAGVGPIGTHVFRHSYRSWLDSIGTPVGVQQKLMRHSDIRTTMNVYGDAMTPDMTEANRRIVKMVLPS